MNEIMVRDLIKHCNCKLLIGSLDEKVNECFINSKEVTDGGCFFGIRGENIDGSIFYKDAFDKGANICVLSKMKDLDLNGYDDKTVVIADDTTKTLQLLATYKRSLFKGEVIGITGSVGKTSTRRMITNILKSKYKVLSTSGNQNSQLGLPLTILRLTDEDVMVLEMGMSNLGEMHNLSVIAKPTMAVITNVLDSHIENLGSRKNILKAKLEILDGMMDNGGLLFLNNDNDLLHTYNISSNKIKVYTYGILNESDYMAYDVKPGIITNFSTDYITDLNVLGGGIFVYNALIAIFIGNVLGIDKQLIKEKINKTTGEKHRLQLIELKDGITLIDDTYNANFESMSAALEFLSMFKNRKIAVLGDMLELGKISKKTHKRLGKKVADAGVNCLITIGKHSKLIGKNTKKMSKGKTIVKHFKNETSSRCYIKNIVKPNDVILIKASNGIKLVNLVNYIQNNFT